VLVGSIKARLIRNCASPQIDIRRFILPFPSMFVWHGLDRGIGRICWCGGFKSFTAYGDKIFSEPGAVLVEALLGIKLGGEEQKSAKDTKNINQAILKIIHGNAAIKNYSQRIAGKTRT
jgi:hypothetical protein